MAATIEETLIQIRLGKAERAIIATKSQLVGTHDFIPRTEYPFITQPILSRELSEVQSNRFFEYTNLLKAARSVQSSAIRTTAYFSAIAAAIGIGECGEQCHALLRHLFVNQEDIPAITQVVLDSPISSIVKRHIHSIILFGDCSSLGENKSLPHKFASLPPTTIVIDPFLNYAGQAINYFEHCKTYLDHFRFNSIIKILEFSSNIVEQLNKDFEDGYAFIEKQQSSLSEPTPDSKQSSVSTSLHHFERPVGLPEIYVNRPLAILKKGLRDRESFFSGQLSLVAQTDGDKVISHLQELTKLYEGWKFYKKAKTLLFTEQNPEQFKMLAALLQSNSSDIIVQQIAKIGTPVIKIPASAFPRLMKLKEEDFTSLRTTAQETSIPTA